jgi:hypothetical protein
LVALAGALCFCCWCLAWPPSLAWAVCGWFVDERSWVARWVFGRWSLVVAAVVHTLKLYHRRLAIVQVVVQLFEFWRFHSSFCEKGSGILWKFVLQKNVARAKQTRQELH